VLLKWQYSPRSVFCESARRALRAATHRPAFCPLILSGCTIPDMAASRSQANQGELIWGRATRLLILTSAGYNGDARNLGRELSESRLTVQASHPPAAIVNCGSGFASLDQTQSNKPSTLITQSPAGTICESR